MPGFIATMNMKVSCVHGGPAQPAGPNPHIKLGGTPVPMANGTFAVAGCAFNMGAAGPKPCLTATFAPATLSLRVKSLGMGLILESSKTSPAIVTPGAPPVPLMPISSAGQLRVRAK